jgi:hypothetical protein
MSNKVKLASGKPGKKAPSKREKKAAPGKAKPKWTDRLSGPNAVVALIGGVLAIVIATATITATIYHFFFEPQAELTAQIQKVTVQQGVTYGSYLANSGGLTKKIPGSLSPSPNANGMLVEVQVQLSGHEADIYSGM